MAEGGAPNMWRDRLGHVGAPLAPRWRTAGAGASVAALSRRMHWRNSGYLPRQ